MSRAWPSGRRARSPRDTARRRRRRRRGAASTRRGERLRPDAAGGQGGRCQRAWPSGRRAPIAAGYWLAAAAAAWCCFDAEWGAAGGRSDRLAGQGGAGRQPQLHAARVDGSTSPRPPTAARSDPCPGRMISPRPSGSRPRHGRKSIPRGERPHDTTRSETKNRPGTFLGSFRRGWSFPRLPVGFQELKNTSFFQAFLVTRDYKMGKSRV